MCYIKLGLVLTLFEIGPSAHIYTDSYFPSNPQCLHSQQNVNSLNEEDKKDALYSIHFVVSF